MDITYNEKKPSLKESYNSISGLFEYQNNETWFATETNANDKSDQNKLSLKVYGPYRKRMSAILDNLYKSEKGRELIDKAGNNGYTIRFEDGLEDSGVCSHESKIIRINPFANNNETLSVIAHELRHASQYISGISLFAESDSTKTQLQINRAMEADAEAYTGLVALELKQLGMPEVWEEFKTDGHEVAKAIETALEKSDPSISKKSLDSKLLLAGFKGWYADYANRELYDLQHIELLDKIKEDKTMGIIGFDRSCPADIIIKKICKTEKGNYFIDSKENPEILNDKEFIGVSKETMSAIKGFFKERKKLYGIDEDYSINEIPVYEYRNERGPDGKRRGNKKSVYWAPVSNVKKEAMYDSTITENKKKYLEAFVHGADATNQENNVLTFMPSKLKVENSR